MQDKELPLFSSDIPPHLLENADPARKYIMEALSINNQQIKWIAKETCSQSEILARVETLATSTESLAKLTNGRVTKLEDGAKEVKNTLHEKEIEIKGLVDSKAKEIKQSLEDKEIEIKKTLDTHNKVIEPLTTFMRFITNPTCIKYTILAVGIFICGLLYIWGNYESEVLRLLHNALGD